MQPADILGTIWKGWKKKYEVRRRHDSYNSIKDLGWKISTDHTSGLSYHGVGFQLQSNTIFDIHN